MSEHDLRARSVSELLDATFSLYRRDASSYIMVTALASVPGLILQLLLSKDPESFSAGTGIAMMISAVISLITYALMTGVVIKLGADVYLGGAIDVPGAVRATVPKIGSLVAVAIMRGFVLGIGMLLAGVGMFYAAARWFAPEAAVVLEGATSSAAFERASALSFGRKWHILKALALAYLIYVVLAIAIGSVAAMIPNAVATLVFTTLYTIIAYPIIGLMTMLLYYDARIRGEGFDVEHLARTLGAPSSTPARP